MYSHNQSLKRKLVENCMFENIEPIWHMSWFFTILPGFYSDICFVFLSLSIKVIAINVFNSFITFKTTISKR